MAKRLKKAAPDYKVTDADIKELTAALEPVTPTLEAESQATWTFALRENRFELGKLLNQADKLLATGVLERASSVTQHDIHESAKCIALERPTAAAFHILRATEGQIKDLHKAYVANTKNSVQMWGNMISELRTCPGPPPAELLDHLDSMRRHFRNPTQHPEKIYTVEESQDLFSSALVGINMIDRALRGLSSGGVGSQPTVPANGLASRARG